MILDNAIWPHGFLEEAGRDPAERRRAEGELRAYAAERVRDFVEAARAYGLACAERLPAFVDYRLQVAEAQVGGRHAQRQRRAAGAEAAPVTRSGR
jgi:hypothetical protein